MVSAFPFQAVLDAMSLVYEQAIVDQVARLLRDNSAQLRDEKHEVTKVQPDWFGGAATAHRIGVNTEMAHQAVEEEFQKLSDSLWQYRDAITRWGEEVLLVDADTNAEMTRRAQAVEQVHADVDEARDESSDDDMGDGNYQPPAEPEAPADPGPPSDSNPAAQPEPDAPASQSSTPGSTERPA